RMGQDDGLPLAASIPFVPAGSFPSGSPPPQLSGAGSTSASFQSALVNHGSSLGHSGSCGDSEYCTFERPEMPTCASPVIGIDWPGFTFAGRVTMRALVFIQLSMSLLPFAYVSLAKGAFVSTTRISHFTDLNP